MSLFPYEDTLTKEIESWKGFTDILPSDYDKFFFVVPVPLSYSTANLIGTETSENAEDKDFPEGSMGDHSKAGGAAGDPPFDDDNEEGRAGLANALGGDSPDHPSDVIATLCGEE
jgi:hypothetical protein